MGPGVRRDDNHAWICPKFADDFATKLADNGSDFRTRRRAGDPVAITREDSS